MDQQSEEDNGVGPMLLAAAKRGNMSLLNQLLEENKEKLEVNSIDGLGNTALHYAAMGNHLEIAQLLFSKYPSINPSIQNFAGDTAVHKAVEKDHLEFLKLLVEHKADTSLVNKKGRNPASMAKGNEAKTLIHSAQVANKVSFVKSTDPTDDKKGVIPSATVVNPLVSAQYDPDMIADEADNDDE